MAQDYDKIFKENIEDIILPLAEKLLQIRPEKLEEIPDDLQTTIERQPDFLKKVIPSDGSKAYILQIEFQTDDEPRMIYRMHEYYALLLRKYELDVHQYVFYNGAGNASMPTRMAHRNLTFSFALLPLQSVPYRTFLESDKPEEVILAILGDFGAEAPAAVVKTVLSKLKEIPTETLRREKCVKQLEVLSNLRNLQSEIIKQLETMAFTYDLEKDIRYQQGIDKGIEKGMEKGIERGSELTKKEMITELLKQSGLSIEQIAAIAKVSVEYVQSIADRLEK